MMFQVVLVSSLKYKALNLSISWQHTANRKQAKAGRAELENRFLFSKFPNVSFFIFAFVKGVKLQT
jgi:hypothetical protein